LLLNKLVARLNALIANIDARAGDKTIDFVFVLRAK
jgi:hypothetical protein